MNEEDADRRVVGGGDDGEAATSDAVGSHLRSLSSLSGVSSDRSASSSENAVAFLHPNYVRAANHQGSVSGGSRETLLQIRREVFAMNADDEFDGDERGEEGESEYAGQSGGEGEERVRRGEAFSSQLCSPQKSGDGGGGGGGGGEADVSEDASRAFVEFCAEQDARSSSNDGGGGGSGRPLRRKGSSNSLSQLDLIDEHVPCQRSSNQDTDDVPPLATPDVSTHGTNEAWLFISQQQQQQQQQQRQLNKGGSGGGGSGAREEVMTNDSSTIASGGSVTGGGSFGRGGSRRGGGLSRSGSVVSFHVQDEVHDIGELKDLAREKKRTPKGRSLTAAAVAEVEWFLTAVRLRSQTEACKQVSSSLKQARQHMIQNIEDTMAVNDNKRSWETREDSLRGGNAWFQDKEDKAKGDGVLRHVSSSPALNLLGLEKFQPVEDE